MLDVPFDVSYHIDDDLRDVPNHPEEMKQAIAYLQARLDSEVIETKQQIQILGAIGSYARVLQDFTTSEAGKTMIWRFISILPISTWGNVNLISANIRRQKTVLSRRDRSDRKKAITA